MQTFKNALDSVTKHARDMGIDVINCETLDPFFKGDLDGKRIWLKSDLSDEEKLFNLLHLIGHTIQWNVDEKLYTLGKKVWVKPSEQVMINLYGYEWEANCYAVYILEYLGFKSLKTWLYDKYKEDINYLMEFYRSGEKKKILPQERIPPVELIPKAIPIFTPIQREESRHGVVMDFN